MTRFMGTWMPTEQACYWFWTICRWERDAERAESTATES